MNVKDFEYIVEIARHGQISKAASRLYITQPALTRFLQRTEEALGVKLFHKSGKQLFPTPAGQCYLEYAEKILNLNYEMEERIQQIYANQNEIIRIGASASRGEFLASFVLPLFNRRYPQFKIELLVNTRDRLLNQLSEHTLDTIFVNSTHRKSEFYYDIIAPENLALVVWKDHPLIEAAVKTEKYAHPFVKTEDWIDHPFIYPAAEMNTGHFIRAYMAYHNLSPNIVGEIYNMDLIFSAVESKMGISIVPSQPRKSVFDGNLCYLSIEDTEDTIWDFSAVYLKSVTLKPGIKKLIETAREVYVTLGCKSV